MKFIILKDITPRGYLQPFIRHRSFIEYDTNRPRAKKAHALVYQQDDQYGTVGDRCAYLTHEELLELERTGFIRRAKS